MSEITPKITKVALVISILSFLISSTCIILQVYFQKSQVNIATRDSMLKRPFLSVESPVSNVNPSGIIDVCFLVSNASDIPAEDVRLNYEILLGQESLKKDGDSSITIMPKQQLLMENYHLGDSRVHDIWNKKINLYISINLKYKGPISDDKYQRYYSKWRLDVTGPTSYQWRMIESRTFY